MQDMMLMDISIPKEDNEKNNPIGLACKDAME